MIESISDAILNSIFAGITMPANSFIQSTNLEFVWYNGTRHNQLRQSGIGPYGSIQELADRFDGDRQPPGNARLVKHKTGSSQTRAITAPYPEPRIYTYQINLWSEHTEGMILARNAFLRAVPRRRHTAMTIDPYGDGETETCKTFVLRGDGNRIDSLEQPRHSEFAYNLEVRGWMFKGQSEEVATLQRFMIAFGVSPITATITRDLELQLQF